MKTRRNSRMTMLITIVSVILLASACDDGRIYEETYTPGMEGRVMKLTGIVNGQDTWPKGYSLVMAGFEEGSNYALITKSLPVPDVGTGRVEAVMSGIGSEVTSVELCVVNRLRERVVSFVSRDCAAGVGDTIMVDAGEVNVGMFNAIQRQVFDKSCTACHGLATSDAAGLNLLEGKSYDALLNIPSTVSDGKMRVEAGNAQGSTLYLILGTSLSAGWGVDHSQMLTSAELVSLVEDWIDNGAGK